MDDHDNILIIQKKSPAKNGLPIHRSAAKHRLFGSFGRFPRDGALDHQHCVLGQGVAWRRAKWRVFWWEKSMENIIYWNAGVNIYIYMCMFSWKKSWRNCECHMKLTCTLAFYMFLLNSPWNEDFKQTNKLVSSSKMGIWLIHDLNWCKNTAAEIDFSGIIWGTVQMGTLWDIWNIT